MTSKNAGAMIFPSLCAVVLAAGPSLSREQAAPSPASATISAVYKCDNGDTIPATYPRYPSPGDASISIHGRKILLEAALSADGGRYLANSGLTAGRVLEWWSKGSGATLSEGPLNKGDNGSKTLITTCSAAADR